MSELEAGRELDALVAVEVMALDAVHWHPVHPDHECCVCENVSPHAYDERGPVYVYVCGCDLDIDEVFGWDATKTEAGHRWTCVEPVPRYSTTWEGMRLVVEKMRERGFVVDITVDCFAGGRPAGVDVCMWDDYRTPQADRPQAHADTAPHAVALAALHAASPPDSETPTEQEP